eukprot:125831-Rhodomonas_salina.3
MQKLTEGENAHLNSLRGGGWGSRLLCWQIPCQTSAGAGAHCDSLMRLSAHSRIWCGGRGLVYPGNVWETASSLWPSSVSSCHWLRAGRAGG